ncbi:hypothetical protein K504DRAFT_72306 [Pleomassaria siparia CBS 279.74]|uniref:Uncharacterized protein n=1 Tax=Pleomassaria siparia CBS 279.74 TaxID=1314801 RepID=A0A6G1K374_9PLEO|nr:hypothetical protein K504DRAFT_72306 [Pleomassaria siparia CBS 279.74]
MRLGAREARGRASRKFWRSATGGSEYRHTSVFFSTLCRSNHLGGGPPSCSGMYWGSIAGLKLTIHPTHLLGIAPQPAPFPGLYLHVAIEEDVIHLLHPLLSQHLRDLLFILQKVQCNVFSVFGQAIWDSRRPPREAVYLAPARWVFAEHAQHVISRDSIGACDDGREAFDGFGEDGEAVVDAPGIY